MGSSRVTRQAVDVGWWWSVGFLPWRQVAVQAGALPPDCRSSSDVLHRSKER